MWSTKHDSCVECGTTETRHQGLGLCRNCYGKARRRGPRREELLIKRREYARRPEVKARRRAKENTPEHREYHRVRQAEWRKKNPERSREILRRWRERHPDKIYEYRTRPDVIERTRQNYLRRTYGENGFAVLDRDNYLCVKCDSNKKIGIHHIDWDKENNSLDNLVLLCNSCHQKLHTFIPMEFRRPIFDHWMAV